MSGNTPKQPYDNPSATTTPISEKATFSIEDLNAALEVLDEVEEDLTFISGVTGEVILPPVQQLSGYTTPPEQLAKDSSEENTPPGVQEEKQNRVKEWAKETKEFVDRYGTFEDPIRKERERNDWKTRAFRHRLRINNIIRDFRDETREQRIANRIGPYQQLTQEIPSEEFVDFVEENPLTDPVLPKRTRRNSEDDWQYTQRSPLRRDQIIQLLFKAQVNLNLHAPDVKQKLAQDAERVKQLQSREIVDSSQQIQSEETLFDRLEKLKHPKICYFLEAEFKDKSTTEWTEIAKKLNEGNIQQLVKDHFEPKSLLRQQVYTAVKTSYNKLYNYWWEKEGRKQDKAELYEALQQIRKGTFGKKLGKKILVEFVEEPKPGTFFTIPENFREELPEGGYFEENTEDTENTETESVEGETSESNQEINIIEVQAQAETELEAQETANKETFVPPLIDFDEKDEKLEFTGQEETEEKQIDKCFEKLLNTRDPRIIYHLNYEFKARSLVEWKTIVNLLEKGGVNAVANKYFKPENSDRYEVFKYTFESIDTKVYNWWKKVASTFDKEIPEILDKIRKGTFKQYLDENYNFKDFEDSDSEDEDEEELDTTQDPNLKQPENDPEEIIERTAEKGKNKQEFKQDKQEINKENFDTPPPVYSTFNPIVTPAFPIYPGYGPFYNSFGNYRNSNTFGGHYNSFGNYTNSGFGNYNSTGYSNNNIFGNYNNQNTSYTYNSTLGNSVNSQNTYQTQTKTPISKSNMTASSSKNQSKITVKQEIDKFTNDFQYVVENIEAADTSFSIQGMPFFRKVDEPEIWYSPHRKGMEFNEVTGTLRIPVEIFFNPIYEDKERKQRETEEYQEAWKKFQTLKKKGARAWTADETKEYNETMATITEYQKKVADQMEAIKKQADEVVKRKNTKRGWDSWLGTPWHDDSLWASPNENETILFEDTQITKEPVIPTTGDANNDLILKTIVETLKITNPVEYRLKNYPAFRGDQDPYTWLAALESALKVNKVTGHRRLEITEACLEGLALSWWNSIKHQVTRFGASQGEDPRDTFKYHFLNQYCGPEKQYEWMMELRQLKQAEGETVTSYATRLQELYRRADPRGTFQQYDIVNQFINGLRNELRVQTRIFSPSTLAEAIARAKATEIAFSDGGKLAAYSLKKGDSELKEDIAQIKALMMQANGPKETCCLCYGKHGIHDPKDCPERSINLLKTQNNTTPQKCYNCNQTGHFSKDCPKKKNQQQQQRNVTTCFNCGKTGHIAKNCLQKNAERCQVCGKTGHTALGCNQIRNNNQTSRNIQFNSPNQRNNSGYNNNNNNNRNNNNNNNNNRNTNFGNRNTRQGNTFSLQNEFNNDFQQDLADSMKELAKSIKNLKA